MMNVRSAFRLTGVFLLLLSITVFFTSCAAMAAPNGNNNKSQKPPTVTGVSPAATPAAAQPVTISVTGANFRGKDSVLWNGKSRPTTIISSSQIQATLLNTDTASPGTAQVAVLDASTGLTSNTVTFTIVQPAALTITTTGMLPSGIIGTLYAASLSASGGTAPYTWTVVSGQLPAGLGLTSSGAISGTPTTAGQFSFQAQVADSGSSRQTSVGSFTLTIASANTALQITTSTLPSGQVGSSYSAPLTATGGVAPYSWYVSSGTLPAGLSLDSAGGSLYGTPTTAGTFGVALGVRDASGASVTANLSLKIAVLALQIFTTALPDATLGAPYDTTVSASGGTPPYTWSLTAGALPPSLSLGATTAEIVGTPSGTGSFGFTLQVQDASLATVSKPFTLSVNSSPVLDQYGGRSDVSCATNSGRWHTEKLGSRWWICTPAGHGSFKQSLYVIGPGPNISVSTKYGSQENWRTAVLNRIKAWGFNTVDLKTTDEGIWATASPSVLVPFIAGAGPQLGAMNAYPSTDTDDGRHHPLLNYAVKNIWAAMPTGFYLYSPWLPAQGDLADTGIYSEAEYGFQHAKYWKNIAASPNVSYLMGVSLDDGDNMWGFMGGDCCGNTSPVPHLGWVTLASSPLQNAGVLNVYSTTGQQFLYYDPEHKSKAALKAFLQSRYSSIAALNTVWRSNYTQWDSTGTTVTGEMVGAGDGRTSAYTSTLGHATPSRYSLAITVNGTVVAGDLAHDNGGGNANPNNSTNGRIWGPYVGGTITYGTGALSVGFATTPNPSAGARSIAQISIASNVVTVETKAQHGLWSGARVSISGTTNYNGTGLGPITVIDAFHFTYAKTANVGTENDVGSYALYAVPGSADVIKVNYVYNGWEIGTGLMDEANNHSWSNTDGYARNTSGLPPAMKADLDNFLYQLAYTYYHGYEQAVHAAFPNAMYLGHDAVNGQIPPRGPILQAAGQVLDVLTTSYNNQYDQTALDYMYANYGDRPIFDSFYVTTNMDSPSAPLTDVSPHFLTQEAKGQGYYDRMNSALNAVYSANGSHPYVGMGVWSYLDMNDGAGNRWGLVTVNDNAYDGHEAAPGTKTCSAPLQAYTCVADTSYTTSTWQPNIYYLGPADNRWYHVVASVGGTYYIFETTKEGTTGGSTPNWTTTLNGLVPDGSQTWKNVGAWTKSASPSNYGDAITNIIQGNGLWLKLTP